MDDRRFDQVTVLLAATPSRRLMLRLFAGALLAGAVAGRGARPVAAAPCPDRAPKPGYAPTANGCGPDGFDWFVPDSWKRASFTSACKKHDLCYGTCNSDRASCDDQFLRRLKLACRRAYPPKGTKKERRLYHRCIDKTYQYYTAVSDYGQGAYGDAQEEACDCCDQDGRGPKCGDTCCEVGEHCVDGQCSPCREGHEICNDTYDGEICCKKGNCCSYPSGQVICCNRPGDGHPTGTPKCCPNPHWPGYGICCTVPQGYPDSCEVCYW